METISLFSGIGGLDDPESPPALLCELDPEARSILSGLFPKSEIVSDVRSLSSPPSADLVTGGWPCQDLSIAGQQAGLAGTRSGLFYDLVRIASKSGAETIVAENVPNLIRMNGGREMQAVIAELHRAGFETVSWRLLNAREFGLPHQRRRLIVVASKDPQHAEALHRRLPHQRLSDASATASEQAGGFYWTAGTHDICHSRGFIPTLKVGSSLSIPSPVAIHLPHQVRRSTPSEAFRLQGFDPRLSQLVPKATALRLAGNAVARPVGQFAVRSAHSELDQELFIESLGRISASGISRNGCITGVGHPPNPLASNLTEFLDTTPRDAELGQRAAAGLVRRLRASGKSCPRTLWELLCAEAGESVVRRDQTTTRTIDGQRDLVRRPIPSLSQLDLKV